MATHEVVVDGFTLMVRDGNLAICAPESFVAACRSTGVGTVTVLIPLTAIDDVTRYRERSEACMHMASVLAVRSVALWAQGLAEKLEASGDEASSYAAAVTRELAESIVNKLEEYGPPATSASGGLQ